MEEDFFLKKMKGVKPLNNKKDLLYKKKEPIKPINKQTYIEKKTAQTTEQKKTNNSEYNISFGEINKDLKRGRIKIDRRVDLHGYSLLEAHEIFKKEIIKTYNNNKRCLLIITGKGLHIKKNIEEENEPRLFYGKIKSSIRSWAEDQDLKNYILTYQDAGIEHGGDGAVFVYLRKKKN